MDKVFIGRLVNTHGLGGEVRILSNFEYKNIAFKVGNVLSINNNNYTILSYRVHKNYDMVTLSGINNIDEALKLKNSNVYSYKKYYSGLLLNIDLLDMLVYCNGKLIGKVDEVVNGNKYNMIRVGKSLIPLIDNFIENIDSDNKKINIIYMKGLIDNED